MPDTYFILKDANASKRAARAGTRSFSKSIFSSETVVRDAPPDLSIETGLDDQQARDASQAPEVIAVARRMPLKLIKTVETIEPADTSTTPWGLDAVGATSTSLNGEEVTVAVLDTGIDARHPAFDGVTLVRQNFTSEDGDDLDGHGTHCAGTIFGRDVEGVRIGIARGVRRALIGKVIGNNAGTDQLIKAVKWAADNGAHVISMSLGYDFIDLYRRLSKFMAEEKAMSDTFAAVIENQRFFDRLVSLLNVQSFNKPGVVIVAASGNESEASKPQDPYRLHASSPSSAEGVLPVGALEKNSTGKLTIAPFSNTGVQLSAPGVNIVSAKLGGGLISLSGTSMACPHVTGVAALHWSDVIRRQLPVKADTVIARLLASASTEEIDRSSLAVSDFGVGCVRAPA